MYNNPYFNVYNPQPSLDRINEQINQLETMKKQIQTPTPAPTNLTQNFQIAPSTKDVIKYAASIDEVQRDMVLGDTPYFSRDMSVVWIKNTKGDIKTYELNEIIIKDEKDLQIDYLTAELEKLKGMMNNEFNGINNEQDVSTSPSNVYETIGEQVENIKSSSVQKVSRGKTK